MRSEAPSAFPRYTGTPRGEAACRAGSRGDGPAGGKQEIDNTPPSPPPLGELKRLAAGVESKSLAPLHVGETDGSRRWTLDA